MELQHDWNLWCTQKLSCKMKLKQLSRYLIINNTPGCPVLHAGSIYIYIFITKALHSWNAFYISTCTDPGQSTVLFWQNSQIVYFKWLSTFNTGITDLIKKKSLIQTLNTWRQFQLLCISITPFVTCSLAALSRARAGLYHTLYNGYLVTETLKKCL